jgi:hypothetical protein
MGEAAWLHRTPAGTIGSGRTVGQPPNLMKTSTALQASANTRVIVKYSSMRPPFGEFRVRAARERCGPRAPVRLQGKVTIVEKSIGSAASGAVKA